jgi:tetratricopeptide (TPR) repeat protein
MTIADRYDLPLSTASPRAAARYQDGMDRVLAFGVGAADCFREALSVDEGLGLAHAGAALVAFFLGDGAGARADIGRAVPLVARATRRERQHVEALAAIIAGDTSRGLALVDEHVAEFPRDALLVNQASSSIGFSGRADREAYRMAFVERLAPAYGEDWWFQSALAFTYHEMGRFDESRRLSERSLNQFPANANASHNLAHVCFETADADGGVAFLDPWLAGYDRRAPYHCHLSWHLALFELHRGHYRRALDIYHRDILGSANPRATVMDGSALLWRYQLYGCAEGPLAWRPLAEVAATVSRPGFVFGDVHAALAYAASGDTAALDRLVDSLRALAARGHRVAGTVGVPLVHAAAAFAAGDHEGCLRHLQPIEGDIHCMGGSHAQWEVFEETMVVCYLKLGRYAEAERLLRRRLDRRTSPRDLLWLGRAQTALGATDLGAVALAAARRAWSGAERHNPEQRAVWTGDDSAGPSGASITGLCPRA